MDLDLNFVHQKFPQSRDHGNAVFCANAGGSFVAQPVLDIFEHFNRHTRVQPYSNFTPSLEAGEAMNRARTLWAEALNIAENELTIGPSTSLNSYVMSQAIGHHLQPGDEIVLTQQDHEANYGAWQKKAEERGAKVRQWPVDPETGLLDPEDLPALLNEKTRWVFFTHCSNIIGTVNPVKALVKQIRASCDARIGVDAVAYAPHHISNLKDLDVDLYLFSLYKVFGPHQGIMYISAETQESLNPQSHFFLMEDTVKQFNPAGPQHAEVAAAAGVLDYFSALMDHHDISGSGSLNADLQSLHSLLADHEQRLAAPILAYLHESNRVRLLGKPHCNDNDRAATIAFKPVTQSSADVVKTMQKAGIGTENGHFYAQRLLNNLGIDVDDGVVRLSLVHYNTPTDVQRILDALDLAVR